MLYNTFGKAHRFRSGMAGKGSSIVSLDEARAHRNSVIKTVEENRSSQVLARFLVHSAAGAGQILVGTSPALADDAGWTPLMLMPPVPANQNGEGLLGQQDQSKRGNLIEMLIKDD